MNEFLADLYGTKEAIGASNSSDVEKLAEAQVLDQVFQSEGINVDQLPDETIVKVAFELFGADSAIVKAAEEDHHEPDGDEDAEGHEPPGAEEHQDDKEEEKTAADLQKADFLGRVMAHSFVQERSLIEKNAAGGKAGAAASVASRLGAFGKKVGKKATNFGAAAKAKGTELAGAAKEKATELGGKANKFVAKHPKAVAGGAAGAGLTAGFLAGRASKGEKHASALDALAEKRAMEILKENGIEVAQPQQTEEEKLAAAIEARAMEMLQEAGYTE